MRTRNILIFSGAMFASALAGSLVGPRPALAVAREIIELQRDVSAILTGQKDLQTQMTQDHTVQKTLIEQSSGSISKLNATMSSLEKSVQDVQANSGARLDTMSTQVQGLSDNLEEIKSRLGKVNQQLVDLQNSVQSIDARHFRRRSCRVPRRMALPRPGGTAHSNDGAGSSPQPMAPLSFRLRLARLLPRTLSIPMASATSLAANTTSLATNFKTISAITATPISPPTRSSTSARLLTPSINTMSLFRNTTRFSARIPKASSLRPRASRRAWLSSNSARKIPASRNSVKS